jgi:hypothetical protein
MFDHKSPSSAKLRLVPPHQPRREHAAQSRVTAMRDALEGIIAADARAKRRDAKPHGWPRLAEARHCRVSFVVDCALIEKLASLSEQLSDGEDEPSIAELLDLALDHLAGSLSAEER